MNNGYFVLIGLILNTFGSLLLIVPLINVIKNVGDDYIVKMDMKTGDYTQKKHLKDRKLGIIGLISLSLGFVFQILGII